MRSVILVLVLTLAACEPRDPTRIVATPHAESRPPTPSVAPNPPAPPATIHIGAWSELGPHLEPCLVAGDATLHGDTMVAIDVHATQWVSVTEACPAEGADEACIRDVLSRVVAVHLTSSDIGITRHLAATGPVAVGPVRVRTLVDLTYYDFFYGPSDCWDWASPKRR